jgi:hypothetical protein
MITDEVVNEMIVGNDFIFAEFELIISLVSQCGPIMISVGLKNG